MIKILLDLGLTEEDIKDIKNFIREDDEIDLIKNIELLKSIGCDHSSIKNIIIGNPYFLQRSNSDIYKLIEYLKELNLTHINLLFDSYPLFLNNDYFEVRDFIKQKISSGELLESIIDEIDSNPSIIDEV